jgi:hypothetical protein
MVGAWSRSFYVSSDAVYVWVGSSPVRPDVPVDVQGSSSFLYRLPLRGGATSAVRTAGSPIDQFSFRQTPTGDLLVFLASQGQGDAFAASERSPGAKHLLRVPARAFGTQTVGTVPIEAYHRLPGDGQIYGLQNRHVGDHLLYGVGPGFAYGTERDHRLHVVPVDAPERTVTLSMGHAVERIEPLGAGAAAVIGRDGRDLVFSSLALGGEGPVVRDAHRRPGANQGETRSHGFFFKPGEAGGGVLGLPIRSFGAPSAQLRWGSAELTFLGVTPELRFAPLGGLPARPEGSVDDKCKVSCVDWYGNARPIFFRGRVFALLGYELVEGVQDGERIREVARIDFTPRALVARR